MSMFMWFGPGGFKFGIFLFRFGQAWPEPYPTRGMIRFSLV